MGSLGNDCGGVAPGATADRGVKLELTIKSEPLDPSESLISSIPQNPRIKSEPASAGTPSSSRQSSEQPVKEDNKIEDDQKKDITSNTIPFDLEVAIAKLVDLKLTTSDIDADPATALQNLDKLRKAVKDTAVKCRGGRNTTPEQWEKVKLFLCTLSRVTTVTPALSKSLNLRSVLELFTNPIMKFPQEYFDIAQELIKRIEAQNGFQTPPPSPTDTETINAKDRKRKSIDDGTPAAKKSRESSTSGSSGPPRLPDPNHPIWGDSGIMRGLVWDGARPRLNPDTEHRFKRDFRVHRHNGLTIGDCWPKQIAALRDGAHGSSQGGISGNERDGAFSVVLSSHYVGFDQDSGSKILYSAPNAEKSESATPDSTSQGVKALKRSIETGNPVRVLRSSRCAWEKRPAAGIRYDGLYRVTEGTVQTNGKGGKFWGFTLKRLKHQDPIQTHLPDGELMGQFALVNDGY